MRALQTDFSKPVPSTEPSEIAAGKSGMSDDECVIRLANAVKEPASADLDEVARLIARLAVTIE